MATCNGPNQDPLLETTSIENRAICRQIAACFARILNPGFFDRCVHQTPHGAGGSGYGAAVTMDLQRKLFFWRVSSLIAYKKKMPRCWWDLGQRLCSKPLYNCKILQEQMFFGKTKPLGIFHD